MKKTNKGYVSASKGTKRFAVVVVIAIIALVVWFPCSSSKNEELPVIDHPDTGIHPSLRVSFEKGSSDVPNKTGTQATLNVTKASATLEAPMEASNAKEVLGIETLGESEKGTQECTEANVEDATLEYVEVGQEMAGTTEVEIPVATIEPTAEPTPVATPEVVEKVEENNGEQVAVIDTTVEESSTQEQLDQSQNDAEIAEKTAACKAVVGDEYAYFDTVAGSCMVMPH